MNEQAFLDQILENPRDLGARLVFADWLEERGEADHADFIRISAKYPNGVTSASDEIAVYNVREQFSIGGRGRPFGKIERIPITFAADMLNPALMPLINMRSVKTTNIVEHNLAGNRYWSGAYITWTGNEKEIVFKCHAKPSPHRPDEWDDGRRWSQLFTFDNIERFCKLRIDCIQAADEEQNLVSLFLRLPRVGKVIAKVRAGFVDTCAMELRHWQRIGGDWVRSFPLNRVEITDRWPAQMIDSDGKKEFGYLMHGHQVVPGTALPATFFPLKKPNRFKTKTEAIDWLSEQCLRTARTKSAKPKRRTTRS